MNTHVQYVCTNVTELAIIYYDLTHTMYYRIPIRSPSYYKNSLFENLKELFKYF